MTQKIYVYIPGLEYISKGPLHIDAIQLKVTANQVKNGSSSQDFIPVYLFKGNGSDDIKGNIVYKQIVYNELGKKSTYPTSGPSATQAKRRAKKGRYYDFVKEENNITKHLITPQPYKVNGTTCSNLNLYEHDGLFVVELDKLNTDLVLNFTFYSRIDNSESTEGVITFGAVDSEGDYNTIDFNKYVEVGKWIQTYNPAISGVKEEEFKRADFEQQYFDLKGWATSDNKWEIPVNADILVTRLGTESDILVQTSKKVSAQYVYVTDATDESNFRHHIKDDTLTCNQYAVSHYRSYSPYYRKFYKRGNLQGGFDNYTADDERINGEIKSYNPDKFVAVGVPYDSKKLEWTGPFFVEYGLATYDDVQKEKQFYITYANLENFGYLYRNFPDVNINNVSNQSKYSDTDKKNRPIAACRIDSHNLSIMDLVYIPRTSTFKNDVKNIISDFRSMRWAKSTNSERTATWLPFQIPEEWDPLGRFSVALSVKFPDTNKTQSTVTSDNTILFNHYDLGRSENWPPEITANNRYINNLITEANRYRESGGTYGKNEFTWNKSYYCTSLNSTLSEKDKVNDNFFWFSGGDKNINLKGSSLITQTKAIRGASIPIWHFYSKCTDQEWSSTADVKEVFDSVKKNWAQTNKAASTINDNWEFCSYNADKPFYIFTPEMWYIDLNKSNITYSNKADFKVCPMIYTDSTGYLTENGSAVVAQTNIITDNLLVDDTVLGNFEIQRVLEVSDTILKAPYDLIKQTILRSTTTKQTRYDTSFCNEKRFLLAGYDYSFRKNSIKLEAKSLYVLKALTLFPFTNNSNGQGISVKLGVSKSGSSYVDWYTLSDNGLLLIHNLGEGEAELKLESLRIRKDYFDKIQDETSYTIITHNILSGIGLYKVNLEEPSTNTIILKEALDNSDYKKSSCGFIYSSLDNINTFYNRIIFPAAHCAEENVVFCNHINNYNYREEYLNIYFNDETNFDPIVHNYNFKYLPDKAVYLVVGFYTIPTSGDEYKISDKYTPFSDKYNFEGNPVIGITVKQI